MSPIFVISSHNFTHGLLIKVHIASRLERHPGHMHLHLLMTSIIEVALADSQCHLHNVRASASELAHLQISQLNRNLVLVKSHILFLIDILQVLNDEHLNLFA